MGADDFVDKMADICNLIPDNSRVGKGSEPIKDIKVS